MLFLTLSGCGGSDFGDVRVPTEQQHVLKAEASTGGTPVAQPPLSLPADHPFAIHIKKSNQNPGPDGLARAESNATPEGQASAVAEAGNGGTASAEFNIGHRIENRGPAQSVAIRVEFGLKQSLGASRQPASETIANANLQLVVVDSRKKVLARLPIVQATSDQASGDGNTQDQRVLTVQFEPQQSYDVMLYGKVDAASAAKQEAHASLQLEHVRMQLNFSKSATQPAGQ